MDRRFQALRTALAIDFRASSFGRRIALVAVAWWLAYEWGPGNETVTPWLLVTVMGHAQGPGVILWTALVGFLFTGLQQTASGFTALAGFSIFKRTATAAWTHLLGDRARAAHGWTGMTWAARCALVFALGTTAVALAQVMSTGKVGVRPHARVILMSATLCGSLVAAVGVLGAALAYLGRCVPALAGLTNWLLQVCGSPWFWLGLIAVGVAVRWVRTRRARPSGDGASAGIENP